MIGETKSKTVEEKNAIKQNTNTDEIKGSTTNQLEEMKNKNKIDKSQVAPK